MTFLEKGYTDDVRWTRHKVRKGANQEAFCCKRTATTWRPRQLNLKRRRVGDSLTWTSSLALHVRVLVQCPIQLQLQPPRAVAVVVVC